MRFLIRVGVLWIVMTIVVAITVYTSPARFLGELAPGKISWSEAQKVLLVRGYTIYPSQDPTAFDVIIYPLNPNRWNDSKQFSRVVIYVSNDQITGSVLEIGILNFVYARWPKIYWPNVDPVPLLDTYGTPDDMVVSTNGRSQAGYFAQITILWERAGLAIDYNLEGVVNNDKTISVCISPKNLQDSQVWRAAPDQSISQIMEYGIHFFIPTQVTHFSPTLFIGIDNLTQLAQVLHDGKCLAIPY